MKMKSICIFAKYKDTESWNRDTKREMFKEGKVVWEAYDILDFGGAEDIVWDEMMIVEYPDEKKYNQALENIKNESKLENYYAYLFEPYPSEQNEKINRWMKKARDDPAVDLTPGGAADEVYADNAHHKTNKNVVNLFQGDYRDDIVIANFLKYPEVAVYDDGHKAEGETGKQTYKKYGRAALQTQGKVGAQYDAAGLVKSTIASDNDIEWDAYVFVWYPTVDSFEKFWRSRFRMKTTKDQMAGLAVTYAYIVKTYK